MTRNHLFWFAAGVGSVWAYHRFVKPIPTNKMA